MKDRYLVMKGAIGPWDMESLVKECELWLGIVEKDGVRDFCVVEGVPTLPWWMDKARQRYCLS